MPFLNSTCDMEDPRQGPHSLGSSRAIDVGGGGTYARNDIDHRKPTLARGSRYVTANQIMGSGTD